MSHKVIPPRVYVVVYLCLLLLTATTVVVAFLELGSWHVWVGLTIAGIKAMLVILFFMHVYYSSRLTWVIALSGLFWLIILFTYVLTDYLTRGWLGVLGR
jgi:cytochrome c oxidase subunit IV